MEPLRLPLARNARDPKAVLRVLLPFWGAMILAVVLGVTFDAAGTGAGWTRVIATAIVGGILLGGICLMALAIRKGTMVAPSMMVEIDASSIRLLDLATGASVAGGPRQGARVDCVTTRYRGRSMNHDVAAIALVVPGGSPTLLGTLKPRFTWKGETPSVLAPEFLVTEGEWLALVDRLGLSSRLNDIGAA